MLDSLIATVYTQSGPTQLLTLDSHTNGGSITIPVSTFQTMFGAGPYTYAGLSATPQAAAGWQVYFDQWKTQGLIS